MKNTPLAAQHVPPPAIIYYGMIYFVQIYAYLVVSAKGGMSAIDGTIVYPKKNVSGYQKPVDYSLN